MIRVAIVEDDAMYMEQLKLFLKQHEESTGEAYQITCFSDGEDIVSGYKAQYDLILLDIEMRFLDGISTAEEIRRVDSAVVIMFITNMPQYAIKGYAVDALDYVLKPISYFAFTQRIERAISRMKRREERFITLPVRGGKQRLDVGKIRYIEAVDRTLEFHTNTEVISSRGSLATLEQELGTQFYRCNKCYLVNLKFVTGVQGEYALLSDTQLQISRAKKRGLLDALNNYLNEVGK